VFLSPPNQARILPSPLRTKASGKYFSTSSLKKGLLATAKDIWLIPLSSNSKYSFSSYWTGLCSPSSRVSSTNFSRYYSNFSCSSVSNYSSSPSIKSLNFLEKGVIFALDFGLKIKWTILRDLDSITRVASL